MPKCMAFLFGCSKRQEKLKVRFGFLFAGGSVHTYGNKSLFAGGSVRTYGYKSLFAGGSDRRPFLHSADQVENIFFSKMPPC